MLDVVQTMPPAVRAERKEANSDRRSDSQGGWPCRFFFVSKMLVHC